MIARQVWIWRASSANGARILLTPRANSGFYVCNCFLRGFFGRDAVRYPFLCQLHVQLLFFNYAAM